MTGRVAACAAMWIALTGSAGSLWADGDGQQWRPSPAMAAVTMPPNIQVSGGPVGNLTSDFKTRQWWRRNGQVEDQSPDTPFRYDAVLEPLRKKVGPGEYVLRQFELELSPFDGDLHNLVKFHPEPHLMEARRPLREDSEVAPRSQRLYIACAFPATVQEVDMVWRFPRSPWESLTRQPDQSDRPPVEIAALQRGPDVIAMVPGDCANEHHRLVSVDAHGAQRLADGWRVDPGVISPQTLFVFRGLRLSETKSFDLQWVRHIERRAFQRISLSPGRLTEYVAESTLDTFDDDGCVAVDRYDIFASLERSLEPYCRLIAPGCQPLVRLVHARIVDARRPPRVSRIRLFW